MGTLRTLYSWLALSLLLCLALATDNTEKPSGQESRRGGKGGESSQEQVHEPAVSPFSQNPAQQDSDLARASFNRGSPSGTGADQAEVGSSKHHSRWRLGQKESLNQKSTGGLLQGKSLRSKETGTSSKAKPPASQFDYPPDNDPRIHHTLKSAIDKTDERLRGNEFDDYQMKLPDASKHLADNFKARWNYHQENNRNPHAAAHEALTEFYSLPGGNPAHQGVIGTVERYLQKHPDYKEAFAKGKSTDAQKEASRRNPDQIMKANHRDSHWLYAHNRHQYDIFRGEPRSDRLLHKDKYRQAKAEMAGQQKDLQRNANVFAEMSLHKVLEKPGVKKEKREGRDAELTKFLDDPHTFRNLPERDYSHKKDRGDAQTRWERVADSHRQYRIAQHRAEELKGDLPQSGRSTPDLGSQSSGGLLRKERSGSLGRHSSSRMTSSHSPGEQLKNSAGQSHTSLGQLATPKAYEREEQGKLSQFGSLDRHSPLGKTLSRTSQSHQSMEQPFSPGRHQREEQARLDEEQGPLDPEQGPSTSKKGAFRRYLTRMQQPRAQQGKGSQDLLGQEQQASLGKSQNTEKFGRSLFPKSRQRTKQGSSSDSPDQDPSLQKAHSGKGSSKQDQFLDEKDPKGGKTSQSWHSFRPFGHSSDGMEASAPNKQFSVQATAPNEPQKMQEEHHHGPTNLVYGYPAEQGPSDFHHHKGSSQQPQHYDMSSQGFPPPSPPPQHNSGGHYFGDGQFNSYGHPNQRQPLDPESWMQYQQYLRDFHAQQPGPHQQHQGGYHMFPQQQQYPGGYSQSQYQAQPHTGFWGHSNQQYAPNPQYSPNMPNSPGQHAYFQQQFPPQYPHHSDPYGRGSDPPSSPGQFQTSMTPDRHSQPDQLDGSGGSTPQTPQDWMGSGQTKRRAGKKVSFRSPEDQQSASGDQSSGQSVGSNKPAQSSSTSKQDVTEDPSTASSKPTREDRQQPLSPTGSGQSLGHGKHTLSPVSSKGSISGDQGGSGSAPGGLGQGQDGGSDLGTTSQDSIEALKKQFEKTMSGMPKRSTE